MDETIIKKQWAAKREEMQSIQQIKLIETRVKRLKADDKRIQVVIKKAQERAQKHQELCQLNEKWQLKLQHQKFQKLQNQQYIQEKHSQERYLQTLLHSEKLKDFTEKRKKRSMQLRIESFRNQQQIQHQKQLEQERAKRYQFLVQANKNEARMRISDFWSLQIKSVENDQFEKLKEIREKGQKLQTKLEQLNEEEKLVLHKIQRSQETHQNIKQLIQKPVSKVEQIIDDLDQENFSQHKKNSTQNTFRKPGQVYINNMNQNILQQLRLPQTAQQKLYGKKKSIETTNQYTENKNKNDTQPIERSLRSTSARQQITRDEYNDKEFYDSNKREKQIQTTYR